MFYCPLLNKAASKLTTRGALQYVHQDPNTCDFVASDGKVMLVENNGTPFMADLWDTITQMPVNSADKYPDWKFILDLNIKEAKRLFLADMIKFKKGLAIFNNLYVSAKTYSLVQDFIGPDMIINSPGRLESAIYFRNSDKSRQALIMPFVLTPETVSEAEWNVLDACGTIIHTTSDIREAEIFGLTVKLAGEK